MRPDERDLKLLWDMVDAARLAVVFTAGITKGEYLDDRKTRYATERVIEIIGEAARKVSDETRALAPNLAWGAIVATRHILAHDYDEVNHDHTWRIATIHAPELIQLIQPILDTNPPGPDAEKDLAEP
ncbi:MAG: DUF86 domain-containing protein [Planctomycetota bacterium]|nr:DUF86 domain-containing protein [Planctomycetota bacterium]